MTILTLDSLDFARAHITKYYDSDFFPKAFEFDAIWHSWDLVVGDLRARNVGKLQISAPRAFTAPKPKGGFRVVHQLQPVDSLVYTALAAQIAPSIEQQRAPRDDFVACSYRFNLANGGFFEGGNGWDDFVARTEELAEDFEFVLVTDITDFYNQINLHRLQNAIERADNRLKPLADDIEDFIGTLNTKASKGIPVGPAASIVMAEAVLTDVDDFIFNKGFTHTRYVDDFRVFGASERELKKLLDMLTVYLYENHRLTLSAEKTQIRKSAEFVQESFHNAYAELRLEILDKLQIFNPYTEQFEELEFGPLDPKPVLEERLTEALGRLLTFPYLDLGLARAVIRHARRAKIGSLAPVLLENFPFFTPVVNDLILYLIEVTDDRNANELMPLVERLLGMEQLDNALVRLWVERYLVQRREFLQQRSIREFIDASPHVDNQALAAITLANVAWVRERKAGVLDMSNWHRRAVLHAARILPSDERRPWLHQCRANSPVLLDRLVATWVLETTN